MYIYIYSIFIKNKGYALGLALVRRKLNKVSHGRLRELMWHEYLLLILLDDFFVLLVADGQDFR